MLDLTQAQMRTELRRQIELAGGMMVWCFGDPTSGFNLETGLSGVYIIENTSSPLFYIGQSSNLRSRAFQHKYLLNAFSEGRGKEVRANRRLATSWRRYGPKAFVFRILELCPISSLVEREQHWLDVFRDSNPSLVCNAEAPAYSPRRGVSAPVSAEVRAALAEVSRQRSALRREEIRLNQEHKDRLNPPRYSELLTKSEALQEIQRSVNLAGGVKEFARVKGFSSHAPLSLILSGKRDISETIANSIGLMKIQTYRKAA